MVNPPPIDSSMRLFDIADICARPREANLDRIRSLCRNAYLGGTSSLIRAMGRYKMYVDTADIGISSHLLLDGYWEIWVTEAIAARVRPGMVVADIGANLGYFALIMADLVGPTGLVHAFEPNPAMLHRLRNSLLVNGFAPRTQVHALALTDRDGETVSFGIPADFPGGGSLNHHGAGGQGMIQVSTARLDSRDDWMRIELMKIDVEGAEELVWRGVKGLLDGSELRTVMMEFNSDRYSDPAHFLETIRNSGFTTSLIHPDDGAVAIAPEVLIEQLANQEVMLLLER